MLIEGICIQVNGSIQDAIDEAGAAYRRKYGVPPTHVSLPGYIVPPGYIASDELNLYTLHLARPTSAGKTRTRHAGTVIVGRVKDGSTN